MKNIKTNKYMDGFTLIELLAVILILGIIALIAIPAINNILAEVEMGSVLSNMRNLIDAGEKYYARNGYIDTSCISVNDPELDFESKLGDITGTICFDGSEAYLKDVAYQEYIINGTTDDLVYSKINEDKKPVFTLNEEVFDGVDDYYDTGYALFDEAKDFTIIVSFTSESNITTVNPITLFHCMYEASPYPGITLDHQYVNGRLATTTTSKINIFPLPLNGNKNVLVVKRDTTISNKTTYYVFNSNGEIVSSNLTISSTTFDLNLLVGAYQSTAGVKGRFFKGTIHQFDLYMDSLDDTTIKSIMQKLNN